jgi:hypothetical protein
MAFGLGGILTECRGKLPRIPWAAGYGQKHMDTTSFRTMAYGEATHLIPKGDPTSSKLKR